MIEGATIERFRGIQKLEVDGFGRVNLIIGKNDCGKTALMEALMIAESAEGASYSAHFVQKQRRSVDASDFDRFWKPLFWNQDADQGFRVGLHDARKALHVEFRKGSAPPLMVADHAAGKLTALESWAIDVRISDGVDRTLQIVGNAGLLQLVPPPTRGAWWIAPSRNIGREEIGLFSKLKFAGKDGPILDFVHEVDPRIAAIEILSPTGTEAELFVRLAPTLFLPIAMMGDGVQRCFEIGVAAAAHDWPFLYIDEIDNGLHHSALEPVWRWLAVVSKSRDIQVFATTHSEECIHAAADAFAALDDDGLRVIRLDRHADHTSAAVYDRDLVAATNRMGMEIRG